MASGANIFLNDLSIFLILKKCIKHNTFIIDGLCTHNQYHPYTKVNGCDSVSCIVKLESHHPATPSTRASECRVLDAAAEI